MEGCVGGGGEMGGVCAFCLLDLFLPVGFVVALRF